MNASQPCKILIDDGSDLFGATTEHIEVEVGNQYTIQGDLFARSIREGTEPPVSLEDSIKNMAVIDAIFRSAKSRQWETPMKFLPDNPGLLLRRPAPAE